MQHPWIVHIPVVEPPLALQLIEPDGFPNVHAAMASEDQFRFWLDTVLDGIQARVDRRAS